MGAERNIPPTFRSFIMNGMWSHLKLREINLTNKKHCMEYMSMSYMGALLGVHETNTIATGTFEFHSFTCQHMSFSKMIRIVTRKQ
eukprot:2804256-Karenia_brevis.AAC.1